jgi:hypothetical protein
MSIDYLPKDKKLPFDYKNYKYKLKQSDEYNSSSDENKEWALTLLNPDLISYQNRQRTAWLNNFDKLSTIYNAHIEMIYQVYTSI